MGQSQRNDWELKVTNGEERERTKSSWASVCWAEEEEEPLERDGKGINTPNPNGQLSHGSATAQLR